MEKPNMAPNEYGVAPVPRQDCAHHWEIETPNGPTSEGVCRTCGATRDFSNSTPSSADWTRKRSPSAPKG